MSNFVQIFDFDNYEVSDVGEVRNKKTGRILKPRLNNGYYQVGLRKDKKTYQRYIHQLVAYYFVDGYAKGLEVDHINRVKTDNRAENLRWVSHRTNLRNARFNRTVVNETTGDEFGSVIEAAEWLVECGLAKNVASANASLHCHFAGKTKTCGKCEWRIIDNEDK